MSKFVYTDDDLLEIQEPVAKHGEHDQKTHGSWATGGTIYTSIIDRLSKKDVTGFSLDISSLSQPTSGYMCSNNGAEQTVAYKDFFSSRDKSRKFLLDYMEKNADALSERGAYFGIWVVKDQGTVYLDVSRRYDSRGEAVRAGFDNDQQSIYDIEQDQYIYMKDEENDRADKSITGGSSDSSQSNDPRAKESLRGGDSQRNRGQSPHVCLGRYQGVEKHLQGQHDQATHGAWASGRYGADSVKSARDGAKEYVFKVGLKQDDSIDYTKVVANRERASRIADIYETLPKMDRDAVDEYEALASEVTQQFDYMTKTLGVKVEFVASDPYKTSKEMFDDVSTGNLKVLQTATTGAHPIFSDTQNDMFRAVHDYFGHAATGRGFGQDGEEAAWVHHSQMFTTKAQAAMSTETRGQNSFFNNRGKQFADQKVALLPEEFWAVPKVFQKTYKVIKFAAGLIPTFKHLQGQHDQSTHGAWANGGYTDEEASRIAALENLGPTFDDLNSLSESMDQADMSDLKTLVENDQGLYNQAIDGIEERVAALVEESKYEYEDTEENNKANEALYNRLFEQVQNEMIDEFIQQDDGSLAQLWQEQNGGGGFDQYQMIDKLNEVYGFEYTGKNAFGTEMTLRAEVAEIYQVDEDTLGFRGQILDDDGNEVGRLERTFYRNETGGWNVEHDYFKIDDEEAQGTGFGSRWIQRQEDWYIAKGFDAITVGTAWDGARHWARAGYDWNPNEMDANLNQLMQNVRMSFEKFDVGTESRTEFDDLIGRMVFNYEKGQVSPQLPNDYVLKDFTYDDFPIPADFANIGINRMSTLTPFPDQPRSNNWDGKSLMSNAFMKYKKVLTAEGTSIQQGPIDRDGDGLVYDGTAREKPAPSK
jgi:hypothetical protein